MVDAGYKTPAICRKIIEGNRNPVVPYKRPMTKKGFFKKHEYIHNQHNDCYICPNNKLLTYSTTSREGYRIYKSNPQDCANCPFREKCTLSKNHTKVVTRHVWQDYYEQAEHLRHTDKNKALYKLRSETIERVFADAKEKHRMRYTQYRGRSKVIMEISLVYSCMNLKKLAVWVSKGGNNSDNPSKIASGLKYCIIFVLFIAAIKVEEPFRQPPDTALCLRSEPLKRLLF